MATALSSIANASVTFEVADSGTYVDPDTGNVIAVSETVTVPCYLKAEKVDVIRYPGVDVVDQVYEGYATEPLDTRIVPGTPGVLSFAGEPEARCEVFSLRLPYGGTGTIGGTLVAALGEKIQLVSRGQR
jgi:hypothetical protein